MNTFEYPASAIHFRAFMENFINTLDKSKWRVSESAYIAILYEQMLCAPAREGWHLKMVRLDEHGYFNYTREAATLLAYEQLPNLTNVNIYDAMQYESITNPIPHDPIGKPLDLFLDELINRLIINRVSKSPNPIKPLTRDLNAWFDYFYAMLRSGKKITLKDISIEANYNYDYVRQKRLRYKASKGL